MKTICSIYARISTSDKSQTTENQVAPLKEYAKSKGYTLYKIYSDEMSGKKSNRPGFIQMLKDAKAQKFNHLLFFSLSRFGRRGVLETLQDLRQFDNINCTWESMSQPYLSTIGFMRDAVIGILSAIASEELVQKSNNVSAGLSRTAKSGTLLGTRSKLPFDEIQTLHQQGKTLKEIAAIYKCSDVSIFNTLKKRVERTLTKSGYDKYFQTEKSQVLHVNYKDDNGKVYTKTYTDALNCPAEEMYCKAEKFIHIYAKKHIKTE